MILSFRTDRPEQTVQTQIRLLLIRVYTVCNSLLLNFLGDYSRCLSVRNFRMFTVGCKWPHITSILGAPSSEFVSSSIPSWQILTAHTKPFRGARDLAFCLKVPLDSLLVWASSGGSGQTARMCRLAWTFAAHIGDKYQIRLTQSTIIKEVIITSKWHNFQDGRR